MFGEQQLLISSEGVPPPKLRPGAEGEAVCECHHCHTTISCRDSITYEDTPHCPDCICSCAHCNETFLVDDDDELRQVGGETHEEWRCEDCRYQCSDCDESFAIEGDEYNNSSGGRICNGCIDNYGTCEGCNRIIHIDDLCWDEENEREYCSQCESERLEKSRNESIEEHDYSPPHFQFFKNGAEDAAPYYLGIEVEVEGGTNMAKDVNCDFLYCKEDGSLADGFEIVSHPASIDYWRKWSAGIFRTLCQNRYRSYDTDTCGMHVHVSRDSLSELDILKLLRFFRDNPRFILFSSRRKSVSLLERWAAIDTGNQALLLRKAKRRGVYSESDSRYSAVNTVPSRTVEFRIFRGTLNIDSFKRNLEWVDSLISFVKCHSLYRMNAQAFIVYVGGELQAHNENKRPLYKWIKTYNTDSLQLTEREEN